MKKKPRVFLARSRSPNVGGSGKYLITVGREMDKDRFGNFVTGSIEMSDWPMALCPEKFEAVAPKSCHLKPGEGPIEVEITVRRKK